ncbi:MAG: hypothetical protein QME89_10500 [Actinomycetota bacterium]|nr:hypothetical protein [Actinomycetota bacterium]MDI7252969.1 hypothetical protein [Actinomycetota bacterium]
MFLAGIVGILVILLLVGTVAGCGSKKESGEPEAVQGGEGAAVTESTPQSSQPGNYVFSTTVSTDTKTETFQVTTTS